MVHSRAEIDTREIDTRPAPRLVTRRFWKEVQWLEDHPRHATSLLLMTNPYWASNFDAFEQFGDALTQALQSATESKVEGLGFEGQIQLVFFHPQCVSVRKSTSASGRPGGIIYYFGSLDAARECLASSHEAS